ncbi:hypothetical protein FB561_0115 [Kribbella amoyensis]|uniref:Uncharacterized protein n=1 Tax=Kribbella amoyensis TaxID=996641 RepID=A0A561BJR3_9ACTN|nr:hypothetical protein [Kribbella amoyensis]TWD79065.1 hypothetical protein FB561_0115 [Kribbella amoyensis]
MRVQVAAGLFVLAFAMAGVAAGHQEGGRAEAQGVRCELKLEGASPDQRQTDGEEPPLVMTTEPDGKVKGYLYSPAAFFVAKQQCTGDVPAGVLWQSWQGNQHLDGVQFTESAARVHVYDGDPLGARTWKGPAGAEGVTFEDLPVDIRYGTDIQQTALAEPQSDGSAKVRYMALKYSPDAKAMIPYAGAGVTVLKQCDGGDSTARATANGTGEFNVAVEAGCALRGAVDDSPDSWGLPVPLTVE